MEVSSMYGNAGPYPVTCFDPDYTAAVGAFGYGEGYWFRVLDRRHDEVASGGATDELVHLVDLLERSWTLIDWNAERGLVDVLRPYDAALHSEHEGVNRLLILV